MSKLVDKERLAKLAKALDARAKAAVKAEEERAKLAEAGLQTDVDSKVAQTEYDTKVAALEAEDKRIAGLVATEATARENADLGLISIYESVINVYWSRSNYIKEEKGSVCRK